MTQYRIDILKLVYIQFRFVDTCLYKEHKTIFYEMVEETLLERSYLTVVTKRLKIVTPPLLKCLQE